MAVSNLKSLLMVAAAVALGVVIANIATPSINKMLGRA